MRRKLLYDLSSSSCRARAWYAPCVSLLAIHGCIQIVLFLFLFMTALCNRGAIIFLPVVSFYLYLLLLFSSPNISGHRLIGCLPYFYTWRGPSANLKCRSEMCCMRLAANTGRKKVAKNRHLVTIAQLCRAISSQLNQVSTIRKKLVKQQ